MSIKQGWKKIQDGTDGKFEQKEKTFSLKSGASKRESLSVLQMTALLFKRHSIL